MFCPPKSPSELTISKRLPTLLLGQATLLVPRTGVEDVREIVERTERLARAWLRRHEYAG